MQCKVMHACIVSTMYTCIFQIFSIGCWRYWQHVSRSAPILEIEGSKQWLSIANVANVFDLDAIDSSSDRCGILSGFGSHSTSQLSIGNATRSTHVKGSKVLALKTSVSCTSISSRSCCSISVPWRTWVHQEFTVKEPAELT